MVGPFDRTVVVISDFRDGPPPGSPPLTFAEAVARHAAAPLARSRPSGPDRAALLPTGGYLERLPLALVAAGHADHAEIWTHWRGDHPPPPQADGPFLTRRAFRLDREAAPFASADMAAFLAANGAPAILCVWGLGVSADIMDACADSFTIYNSIDAPALRVPLDLAARFDLMLTAAAWQSDEVARALPGVPAAVLPIGPEFADPLTFRPLRCPKDYDLIYVAAAQPYKRHDILFDAIERLPRTIRALCVFGYGELAGQYRAYAAERGLDIDFIGPPGVSATEVNALMNRARVGVVCGVDDGAPAILTEYMLAGLPVLANAELRCGLQYITPATGMAAPAAEFARGITAILARAPTLNPRATVLRRWTWRHSVARLGALLPRPRQTPRIASETAAPM